MTSIINILIFIIIQPQSSSEPESWAMLLVLKASIVAGNVVSKNIQLTCNGGNTTRQSQDICTYNNICIIYKYMSVSIYILYLYTYCIYI